MIINWSYYASKLSLF